MDTNIKTIIPAVGVSAIIKDTDTGEEVTYPVICWQLEEYEEYTDSVLDTETMQHVIGLVIAETEPSLVEVTLMGKFIRYVYTGTKQATLQPRQTKQRKRPGRPSRSIIRKPGRKTIAINEWAVQQAEAGQTLDDILPEYAARRKMRDVDARVLLRKTLRHYGY